MEQMGSRERMEKLAKWGHLDWLAFQDQREHRERRVSGISGFKLDWFSDWRGWGPRRGWSLLSVSEKGKIGGSVKCEQMCLLME
jgi:hypothetical protein